MQLAYQKWDKEVWISPESGWYLVSCTACAVICISLQRAAFCSPGNSSYITCNIWKRRKIQQSPWMDAGMCDCRTELLIPAHPVVSCVCSGALQHHKRERGNNEWLVLGWSCSEWGGAPALGVEHRLKMEINLDFRALGLPRMFGT